jgi:hypothetical protein
MDGVLGDLANNQRPEAIPDWLLSQSQKGSSRAPVAQYAISTTRLFGESPNLTRAPSLDQMIKDSVPDQQIIRRATEAALLAWFRQSDRLYIARRVHRLRSDRFLDFAQRIGVADQKSAYRLVHLREYRRRILSRCKDREARAAKRGRIYRWPGWETALGWYYRGRNGGRGRYCGATPMLRHLYVEHLGPDYHDVCPHPRPKGYDALEADWPIGKPLAVNAPFRRDDELKRRSMVHWARKLIKHNRRTGLPDAMVVPCLDVINLLVSAGAQCIPLGRHRFLDVDTGQPWPSPGASALFVLPAKTPEKN